MKKARYFLLTVACLAAFGFYFNSAAPPADERSVLRIGVLPDESAEILRQRYAPLLEYIESVTGMEARLVLPADYAGAVKLFAEKKVDLAYFGGLTFVQAHASYGAQPLVMRKVDTQFTSWFVVRPKFAQLELADFKEKKFSFGSKLSTSGHLMPRYFLKTEWQIEPEAYFSQVQYSGAHDKTAYQVRDGEADIGAVNSEIIRKMLEDGRLQEQDLHVLWRTPPYPDYVWAVQSHLDENLVIQLRDAFLGLSSSDATQANVLAKLDAKNFLPAGSTDFANLDKIAAGLGLLQLEAQ